MNHQQIPLQVSTKKSSIEIRLPKKAKGGQRPAFWLTHLSIYFKNLLSFGSLRDLSSLSSYCVYKLDKSVGGHLQDLSSLTASVF